jgi:hypothetical protein
VEILDDSRNPGASDDEIIDDGTRQPVESVKRAHSWDSSQDSDYTYSEDEKASDGRINIDDNSDQDMDLDDAATEDADLSYQDPAGDNIAKTLEGEEQQTSGRQNHGKQVQVIELEEDEKSSEADQRVRPVNKHHDSPEELQSDHSPGQSNIDERRSELLSSPEANDALSHDRRRRFGMFVVAADANAEPPVDSFYTTAPQRLRSLVNKRRKEREQRLRPEKKSRYNLRSRRHSVRDHDSSSLARFPAESNIETDGESEHNGSPEKKTRYNLRSRRHPAGDLGEGSSVAKFPEANGSDSEIETEDEEPRRLPRMTRSETLHKQAKRIIPRSRAARKTAWVIRNLTPRDELHGKRASRQVVEVVIPAVQGSRSMELEESIGSKQVLDMIQID